MAHYLIQVSILIASALKIIVQCSGAHQTPLTPAEWSERFQCKQTGAVGAPSCPRQYTNCNESRAEPPDVCLRDPGDWMWKYLDEMEPEHQVLVREASLDERLANMAYALLATRAGDIELARVDAQDDQLASELRRRLIGRQVNETRCGQHLAWMVDLMHRFQATLKEKRNNLRGGEPLGEQYIRLARVLDSYGRYVSGMMSGKHLLIGSYDQCINSQLLLDGTPQIQPQQHQQLVQMRYCWALVSLELNVSPELAHRKRFDFEVGQAALQVGICLPDSCHSHSFPHYREHIQHLLDSQLQFPSSIYLQGSPNISHISCIADAESPMLLEWPTSGRVLLTLAALWLLLIALATYYTASKGGCASNCSWMKCISFVDNWNDFLEIDRKAKMAKLDRNVTDLDVLNPIKCVSCLWATLVHGVLAIHFGSNALLRDHKLMDTYRSMTLFIASPLVVETYFVLSGILVTYLTLKRMDKRRSVQSTRHFNNNHCAPPPDHHHLPEPVASFKQVEVQSQEWTLLQLTKDCMAIIASRFLRLLPMFYLMFWFKKSLMVFMGSGPFWNHGLNRNSGGQCQHESWWSPLKLSSVYDPILAKCLPQSYTISSELIFICLVAPLVVLIGKFPPIIVGVAVFTAAVSFLGGIVAFQALDKALVWNLADYRSFGFFQLFSGPLSRLYTSPEHRLFSVLFGVIVGWLVYRHDQNMRKKNTVEIVDANSPNSQDDEPQQTPKASIRWFTLTSFVFPVWIFLMGAYRMELRRWLDPYHRLSFGYQMMAARLGWATFSALISLRLLTDWNRRPLVGWWTKSKFWKILSKLNYSILLVHLDLLFLDWQFRTNETTFTIYKLISTFICAYALSIVIGMLVYVLFENPLNRLVKRYIIS